MHDLDMERDHQKFFASSVKFGFTVAVLAFVVIGLMGMTLV
ncbi:hypothetical protein ACFSM5_00540 [Lacibacterium aquatile]|uniref:Aa3-type cytochrome c oxidase subunit IV n=1 Tax=Lacibacterium aquatile TaxID=1168082 RepID=A0ABW5DJU9_9PROT